MIQLNLLPDVKLDYIKAQRSQRLVVSICFIVGAASIALLILMLSVDGLQRKHISDLNKDIKANTAKLSQKPQIGRILTVQNQLESINTLHSQKPQATKLFDYLNEVTPNQVSINSVHIDFSSDQKMSLTGTADSLSSINQYVDTLKFTTYTTDKNSTPTKAFSNVVLQTFGITSNAQTASKSASYTIAMDYDKNIFDIGQNVKFSVPSIVTTRSQVDKPTDLFQAADTTKAKSGGN